MINNDSKQKDPKSKKAPDLGKERPYDSYVRKDTGINGVKK